MTFNPQLLKLRTLHFIVCVCTTVGVLDSFKKFSYKKRRGRMGVLVPQNTGPRLDDLVFK